MKSAGFCTHPVNAMVAAVSTLIPGPLVGNTICALRGELIRKISVLRTLKSKTGFMSYRGHDNDGVCETYSIQRRVFFIWWLGFR